MTDSLLAERRGAVLRLTLNRPDKLNAIDLPLLGALTEALEAAGRDAQVRAIVIAGAGASFCAGADIGQMIERTPDDWERTVDHYLDPIRAIARIGKPVVARLHGNVFGGGLGLAIACDFRVAAESARMCAPFVKLALAGCDMSAGYFLPRLVGLGRATDMMMTARIVGAAEAQAIGLVSRTVPDAELDSAVDALAEQLAGFAPRTTAFTKAAIRRSLDRDMAGEFDYEIFAQVQCLQSADHREGVAAFRERRAPLFRGA
ncbi:MAG: enoyl-CoA hydratase/isomerase family protein [Rubrivivax sp.]|nr:enoyl-CoA hydratase/isomerase family protein [Rubrivivax sp.]